MLDFIVADKAAVVGYTLAMLRTVGFVILSIVGTAAFGQTFHPDIPRAWDDKAVEGFEVPLAQRDRSPRYMTAEEYYALKVRPIYRSYPAYVEGKEPAGYIESLKQKEPEIIFDASKLRTKEDWIQAGKIVFEAENSFSPRVPGRLGPAFRPPYQPMCRPMVFSRDSSPVSAISSVRRVYWKRVPIPAQGATLA